MPNVRKSARESVARKRAREAAAQFRERENNLEALAIEYFVATETATKIITAVEKEVMKFRQKADEQVAAAKETASVVISRMLEKGVSRTEVAERLGIDARELRQHRIAPNRKRVSPSKAASTEMDSNE